MTHDTREIEATQLAKALAEAYDEGVEEGKQDLHHQLQKAREEERERILMKIARIPKMEFMMSDVMEAIHSELDHPTLEDNKSNYELLGNRTVEEYCEHIKTLTHPTKQTED